ncbi:MAG: hypothetical protein FE039_00880 [Thermoplasmata archaeon]|nr:MAG: hypothetical protein FE039_00880 [Thermoplasmata archaeon]
MREKTRAKNSYFTTNTLTIVSTSASALTITPDSYVTYADGTYETVEFTIFNPLNHSVNVTLSTPSSKILFHENNFNISANSSKTISVLIIKDTPFTSKIWVNNQSINIIVLNIQSDITIAPASPQAGKNMIVLYEDSNSTGYILCQETNNVYLFQLHEGLALISLQEEDYGNATVYIKGHTTHFVIQSKYKGNIYMDYIPTLQSGATQNLQVFYGGEPIHAIVTIKTPSGKTYSKSTDMDGKTSFQVGETGEWILTANVYDGSITASFNVTPKPLQLTVPETGVINQQITIQTQQGATVIIQKDEMTWQYTADSEGKISFIPPFPGKYSVIARTDTQQNKATFSVKTKTNILLKNENNEIITKIQINKPVLIQITDDTNKPLTATGDIEIQADGFPIKTFTLTGGSILWTPQQQATMYTLKYNPSDTFTLYSETSIPVAYTPPAEDYTWIYIAILSIIAVIIIVYILIKKQKLPSLPKISFKKQKLPDDLL